MEGSHRPAGLLVALLGAASLVMASTTCLTAVIPAIGRDLSASQAQLQWIADAYPVALAGLLLPAGALLDRFGRRRGLAGGLAVLGAALAWSAVARSPEELIASRAVAGVGAAFVFPATLSTLSSALPAEQRTRAVALWAASVMAGGGYGLVLGGAMAQTASWSGAFLVIAALALVSLLAVRWVPETRDPDGAALDGPGAVLALAATALLTAAVIEVPVRGVGDLFVLGAAGVGAAAAGGFVWRALRVEHPLLDVRVFADGPFAGATLAITAMFGAAFGWFFLSFQYYAYVLGWSPLHSALGLMPNIVPLVALAPAGSRLAARVGARTVIVAGG